MNSAQTALVVSAHNIANLATRHFRREQATQASSVGGGVTTSLSQATQEGNSLETDIVGQFMAKNQFLANLALFKTHDQMMGSLLDVFA